MTYSLYSVNTYKKAPRLRAGLFFLFSCSAFAERGRLRIEERHGRGRTVGLAVGKLGYPAALKGVQQLQATVALGFDFLDPLLLVAAAVGVDLGFVVRRHLQQTLEVAAAVLRVDGEVRTGPLLRRQVDEIAAVVDLPELADGRLVAEETTRAAGHRGHEDLAVLLDDAAEETGLMVMVHLQQASRGQLDDVMNPPDHGARVALLRLTGCNAATAGRIAACVAADHERARRCRDVLAGGAIGSLRRGRSSDKTDCQSGNGCNKTELHGKDPFTVKPNYHYTTILYICQTFRGRENPLK